MQTRVDQDKLAKTLNVSDIDFLLLMVIINLIKTFGHRYGKVIDAVSVAAKFAVYLTYLEEGKNLRRTGFLHHVEPRRVKEIVKEFDTLIESGGSLQLLGTVEPVYLIGISYAWIENFPIKDGQSRMDFFNLTESERRVVEFGLPKDIPSCLALRDEDICQLISELHEMSQLSLPEPKRSPLSESLLEHAKFRLLTSGTIKEVKIFKEESAFVLMKKEYSPQGRQARIQTMIQDLTRSFKWMYYWIDNEPGVMRGIETLEIKEDKIEEAIQELDKTVRDWADTYHVEDDQTRTIALQFLLGPFDDFSI